VARPRWGELTDVPGVQVGHAQRAGDGWLTGVTVVLPPVGTVGSVDVRGGGPGTHETDALDPTTLVPTVDAVTLTGGSAFGLVAAHGVQHWCEENGRGFAAGPPDDPTSVLVPIVPAAAIFDLGRGGDPAARPDAEMGYRAALAAAASTDSQVPGDGIPGDEVPRDGVPGDGVPGSRFSRRPVPRGGVGAGTGARMAMESLRGGVGTASITLDGGLVVGALVVVNALGSPFDQVTGALLGTAFIPSGLPRPAAAEPADLDLAARITQFTQPAASGFPGSARPANTTLAVVATNALLSPAQARRTATAAHDGIARSLSPAHTLFDGDTVFALATGQIEVSLPVVVALQAAAADAVLLAILDAVLARPTTP
jgi:L-aminopeptidase/D-esterase-like protein